MHMKEILLRGLNEDNVYRLQPHAPVPHTSFATSNPSLKLWHHRLSHPAPPTLLHALKSSNIVYFGSLTKCILCLSNKSHKLPFSTSRYDLHRISCILCKIGRLFGLHSFRSHRLSCQRRNRKYITQNIKDSYIIYLSTTMSRYSVLQYKFREAFRLVLFTLT